MSLALCVRTIRPLAAIAALMLGSIAYAQPVISAIANAASYATGPISPGQMVAVFGNRLGPTALTPLRLDAQGRVAQTLAGTQVLFDGIPAPLLYASHTQVAAIVPYALSGRASLEVRVVTGEGTSLPFRCSLARSSPGIFTADSSGRGQGAILNSDGKANAALNPALPGSHVSIFLTGEGLTEPPGMDGTVAVVAARVRENVSVAIGGRPAQVLYAGAAPGNVHGFAQLNVVVPLDVPFGGDLPLEVQVGEGYSQVGVTISIAGPPTPKPGVPQNVTATPSAAGIRVGWVAADNHAILFRIERRVVPLGSFAEVGVAGATDRSFLDSSVVSGLLYEYRVGAQNSQGPSGYSLTASALFSSQLPAPTDFRATAAGPSQINLSWAVPGASPTGFSIERRAEAVSTFAFLATLNSGTVRAFQDATVLPGTKYRYRIRAIDSTGASPYSEEASATTPLVAAVAPVLQAVAVSSTRIRLNWTASAAGIVRFILERRSGGGQYAEVSRFGSTSSAFDDDGLAPSTTYVYRMRLETGSAVSPHSSEVSSTTLPALPAAPTNLRATATSSTEVSLSWTNNAPDAASIRVSLAEGGAAAFTEIGPAGSLVSARITDLRPNTMYAFVVRAQNTAGLSPNSNIATVTTQAPPLPPATSANACLIFVHGSREADGDKASTFDGTGDWLVGRDYWRSYKIAHFGVDIPLSNALTDFVWSANEGSSRSNYFVRYNGAKPYWSTEVAERIAREIIRATDGGADGGGSRCARSMASGGQFWVVAHSGGAQALDYILGNAVPSAPNFSGLFQQASSRLSGVFSVGGAHRGSYLSDLACTRAGQLFFDCTEARRWMQTADAFQVNRFSSYPLKPVWLIGGSKGSILTSGLLDGEDDGVLSFASQYACGGGALASYSNSNVCGNNAKMHSRNFINLDTSYEDHDDERNNRNSGNRQRRAITDGIWRCSGRPCPSDTLVRANQSSAELIGSLLNDRVLTPAQGQALPEPVGSSVTTPDQAMEPAAVAFLSAAEANYRSLSRFPEDSAPIEEASDPLVEKFRVTPTKVLGPPSAAAELSLYAQDVFFASPNPVVLYARYSPVPHQGIPARIKGTIFRQDQTVIATIELHDDGTDGDAVANDLIYTSTVRFSFPRENGALGLHTVVVEAGTGPWVPLVATTYYHYGDPGAKLTGRYQDQIVNGNLAIEAEVEVVESGRYHLEASLYTAGGQAVAWAQNAMELAAGTHRIPLNFYGLIFNEKAIGGPFVLKYVSLSNTTAFPGAKGKLVKDAYVTQPFHPALFANRSFDHPEMIREANRLAARPRNP